jgi:hypothetical protein
MKSKIMAILCSLLLLFTTACSSGKKSLGAGNDFMGNASPGTSALTLYKYDGKTVTYYRMFNNPQEQEILDTIQKVDVFKDDTWNLKQIKYPMYGLEIGGQDGFTVFGAWSNGYWITPDGEAYQFDFDFQKFEKDYKWDTEEQFPHIGIFPCIRHLCQNKNEWKQELMVPAEELAESPNVSMETVQVKNALISVKVTNASDMPWEYGERYSLQVELNGNWYIIPPLPGNWGFILPLYELPAGESIENSYNIEMYGTLPAGSYRIVVENLTAEFEIN